MRIHDVRAYQKLDLIIFVLNDGRILRRRLSDVPRLRDALNRDPEELSRYELVGGGVAVHWQGLDEDISLKGLLKAELRPQRLVA